jgi:ABC-type branched-subunit amino acid transport system ATPase component/branched-subunit amino acid ABC-type transport system permease component
VEHVTSLLFGLGNGGVYAALAIALVLTYRSSGVINFATGTIALYTAYTYAELRNGQFLILLPGLPDSIDLGQPLGFVPAAAIALAVAAVLGALLYLLVFRNLRTAPPLARTGASLGVLVIIQSLIDNRVGEDPVTVKHIFPAGRWTWGDVGVLSDRFYLAVAIVVLTLALTALFRWTRFGLLTRAVAETSTGAVVSGVSPERVALANWCLSAVVAGVAGILISPIAPLTPTAYALVVVPALAAAVVGRFDALVPTVIAGLAIGMLQSEASSLALRYSWFPRSGSSELVPLLVILVALLLVGRSIRTRGSFIQEKVGRAPRPQSFVLPAVFGTLVGVLALAVTDGAWRAAVINSFIAAIIALSLVVVTGYAGQVSLAQLTLAGVGGFALSGLTAGWGVPFPLAPLLAALITAGVGVIVGLPALRLRGLTLGVVTLALAYAIEAAWFRNGQFVHSRGADIGKPALFGLDLGIGSGKAFPRMEFGLLALLTLVVVAWGVARLRTSALGSAMLAVRANERSAAGIGINVVGVKIVSFAVASFIAGIGGSLLGYRQGVITFNSFTALGGLALLSTVYLAGITSVSGGVLSGIMAATGILYFAADSWIDLGHWFPVITGVGLVLTLIRHPEGLATGGHQLAQWLRRFRAFRPRHRPPRHDAAWQSRAGDAGVGPALAVHHLTVRYGGVVAVDDVSLTIPAGRVIGLIGPNGAGKTSVIDAVTGFVRADGEVVLGGDRIDRLPVHSRIRRGLARTFQALELHDDLTVEENVSAAIFGARHDHRRGLVAAALDRVGLSELGDRPAGELSQGERQLVSIARACACDPKVVLLDEPAAGLGPRDTQRLGQRIRQIAQSGAGVLLIDHDLALVLDVCDHIYVLNFGSVLVEGDPDTVRADRSFANAYLGTPEPAPATK